jgi:hypothetical protein
VGLKNTAQYWRQICNGFKCHLAPTSNAALFDFKARLGVQIAAPNVKGHMEPLGVPAKAKMQSDPVLRSKYPIAVIGLDKTTLRGE